MEEINCPYCGNKLKEIWYQVQMNLTKHLMANCADCKKKNMYLPKIENLKIPVVFSKKARMKLKLTEGPGVQVSRY